MIITFCRVKFGHSNGHPSSVYLPHYLQMSVACTCNSSCMHNKYIMHGMHNITTFLQTTLEMTFPMSTSFQECAVLLGRCLRAGRG